MTQLPEGYGAGEAHARLLADSFSRLLGRPLLPGGTERADGLARALFEAPFALLSHGTEDDPVLNYGNRAALALWETDWRTFTRTPSRLTAEPALREARDAFMRQVAETGYADRYTGIRVSASGRRFRIKDAIVWNVIGADGVLHGQAAYIPAHEML